MVGQQRELAERVVVCYEAGCFGYEPARRMQAMGVEVYVIAPQNWDEQGKGQVNDKHDAQVMCRRLSEYLGGHRKALSIVRIPSREEEARRARGRMREQLHRELRRMQAMGRSLLLQREMVVSGRWWAESIWGEILEAMPPWVITQLEIWKQLIEAIEEQLRKIEGELRAGAPRRLIFGEGELTHELLARELIDPERFRNSRQVANYFGLCPRESTSDQRRRLGAITKHGLPAPAPLDGGIGLAGEPLSARLPWNAPLESAARGSESLGGGPQESHCGPGASTGRRPLANGHRTSGGSRTWPGAKSQAQLKRSSRRTLSPSRETFSPTEENPLERRTLDTAAERD